MQKLYYVTSNRLATYHFPDNEDICLFGKENKYVVYDAYVAPENYIGEFDHWPTYGEGPVKNIGRWRRNTMAIGLP